MASEDAFYEVSWPQTEQTVPSSGGRSNTCKEGYFTFPGRIVYSDRSEVKCPGDNLFSGNLSPDTSLRGAALLNLYRSGRGPRGYMLEFPTSKQMTSAATVTLDGRRSLLQEQEEWLVSSV